MASAPEKKKRLPGEALESVNRADAGYSKSAVKRTYQKPPSMPHGVVSE